MEKLEILSKYPFLNSSKNYVKENNLSISEILNDPLYDRARNIGIERLDNAFKNRTVGERSHISESEYIMELLSYPIARMVAVCIDDIYFKRRYALSEARNCYRNLLEENISFIIKISDEFDISLDYDDEFNNIQVFFVDYLKYAPTRYKEWKMINRDMQDGYIYLTKKDLARIIQEALRAKINDELDNRKCSKTIYETFKEDIIRIQNKVKLHRKKIEAAPVGKLDVKKLPPCMKDILSSIQAGENVPHMGRFALVSFLSSLKLSTNDILKLFSSAPDFEEEKSRYQIEHITGDISSTSYKPPACDKMRTYGLCPTDKMDSLCKKKRHPLSYYKAKWYMEKKKK